MKFNIGTCVVAAQYFQFAVFPAAAFCTLCNFPFSRVYIQVLFKGTVCVKKNSHVRTFSVSHDWL